MQIILLGESCWKGTKLMSCLTTVYCCSQASEGYLWSRLEYLYCFDNTNLEVINQPQSLSWGLWKSNNDMVLQSTGSFPQWMQKNKELIFQKTPTVWCNLDSWVKVVMKMMQCVLTFVFSAFLYILYKLYSHLCHDFTWMLFLNYNNAWYAV